MTTNSATDFRRLVDGMDFCEQPRWHDGELFFNDHGNAQTVACGMDGKCRVIADVPGAPCGIGWLPDGRMLVVSARECRVMVREPDGTLNEYADLSSHTPWNLNELAVDRAGRVYVGPWGVDWFGNGPVGGTNLFRIDPDRTIHELPDTEVFFPNGMVITPDLSTIIVAESLANRLTAFTVGDDGTLRDRRTWAAFGPPPKADDVVSAMKATDVLADGICLDAENAVWVADPAHSRILRVEEGGRILQEVRTPVPTFAVELGGPDGRMLFLTVAPFVLPPYSDEPGNPGFVTPGQGAVLMMDAPAPRAGYQADTAR